MLALSQFLFRPWRGRHTSRSREQRWGALATLRGPLPPHTKLKPAHQRGEQLPATVSSESRSPAKSLDIAPLCLRFPRAT